MEVEKEAATGDEAKEEDVPSLPSLGLLGAAWLIQLPPPPNTTALEEKLISWDFRNECNRAEVLLPPPWWVTSVGCLLLTSQ